MQDAAAAAAGAAPARARGRPAQQFSVMNIVMVVAQVGAMLFLFSSLRNQSTPPPTPVAPATPPLATTRPARSVPAEAHEPHSDLVLPDDDGMGTAVAAPSGALSNLWPDHAPMELYVFVSADAKFRDFGSQDKLLWHQRGLRYDWESANERTEVVKLPLPDAARRNQTVYAHVFFTRDGVHPDAIKSPTTRHLVNYARYPLTRHMAKKAAKARSLLGSDAALGAGAAPSSALDAPADEGRVVLYWKPKLAPQLVHDFTVYPSLSALPPTLQGHLRLHRDTGRYYPVVYFNEFALLREHLVEVNDTVQEVAVEMYYNSISLMKWQLQLQMLESWRMQESFGASSEGEVDEIKRMIMETNPYLLALTAAVSTLHMLFDFLAFKNDISFWRNNKSMEGLSVRTIFLNCFFQLVILLYLLDNETSWMILASSAVGLVIELWKLKKAVKFKTTQLVTRWGSLPWLTFDDHVSYKASSTKEYDEIAMKHLMFLVYPLVVGYAAYSLLHAQHKSWYSWVVSSLTGFVYAFGFIMMTPQLFINYKLKSVAHMPWRTMVYKALNTFIDDLFAFIIKMPLMHRLSCFRDDIIFFIYLYQRWVYPVDRSRRNEFGQSGEDPAAAVVAAVPAAAAGQSGATVATRRHRGKADRL